MIFSKVQKISCELTDELIQKHDLKLYRDIWHYSFNKIFFKKDFYLLQNDNGDINLFSQPLNIFTPLPLYVNNNDNRIINLTKNSHNCILDSYEFLNKEERKIFWYLRTTTFEEFLERKTKRSKSAKATFPSSKSYYNFMKKHDIKLIINNFEKDYFIEHYNNLKKPDHLSGSEVINLLESNNPGIDKSWIKTASLFHDDKIVGIASIIDDGKSIFADNVATKICKLSYGICLFTEIVKFCCDNKYLSFDGGISGYYGGYKYKIWLDSFEVYQYSRSFLNRKMNSLRTKIGQQFT